MDALMPDSTFESSGAKKFHLRKVSVNSSRFFQETITYVGSGKSVRSFIKYIYKSMVYLQQW